MFFTLWSTESVTFPTGTPRHVVFLLFSWNFTDAFMLSTLACRDSLPEMTVGNLPALFRPGPSKRGILRINVEDARKAWCSAASFFTNFVLVKLGQVSHSLAWDVSCL